jgi:hypothetical protein
VAGIVISPGPKPELTKVPIAFPVDLYEWMRETAFRRRISMAELVREAVHEHQTRTDPQLSLWRSRDEASENEANE